MGIRSNQNPLNIPLYMNILSVHVHAHVYG